MDNRKATFPQILAPLTFDAYRNNIDPALEAIEAHQRLSSGAKRKSAD
jgi:hypothetical protein